MKIKELTEAISDVVYHVTGLHPAMKILQEKRFRLTASFGTGSERNMEKGDRYYYLSTTRTKTGDYTLHNVYKHGVNFVLNGRWFNQRYKGGPVDYWEGFWIKQREAGSKDRFSEMEDRIFSTEPYIEYGPKTILEVHVLIPEDGDKRDQRFLRNIIYETLKQKIPVFVYHEKDDFILQNKKKSVPIKELISKFKSEVPDKAYQRIGKDYLSGWKELYYKKNKKDLSKEGRRKRDSALYYVEDSVRGLSADIHNMRTTDPDKVKGFLDIMRKEKFKSVREFVEAMQEKWKEQ